MSQELYDWQLEAVAKFQRRGIIKTVPGAGKTLAGVKIAEKCTGRVLTIVPTKEIQKIWKKALPDAEVLTIHSAIKKNHNTGLLILDECHRYMSPRFREIFNLVKYEYILGLSATPTFDCMSLIGDIIVDVPFERANVADFEVTFHGIEMNAAERMRYRQLTNVVKSAMMKHKDFDDRHTEQELSFAIVQRRDFVYQLQNRVPYAVKLVKVFYPKKMIVFCERIAQAEEIGAHLTLDGIRSVQFHSQSASTNIDKYVSGEVKVIVCVGMLNEGFDDKDTEIAIFASTTLSESKHIQRIGRTLRKKRDKVAQVHILLGKETTDMKLLKYRHSYKFNLIKIADDELVDADSDQLKSKYYDGRRFSFGHGGIWEIVQGQRRYYKPNPILAKLKKAKPKGGVFTVNDRTVMTRNGPHITVVGLLNEPLRPVTEEERQENARKVWKQLGLETN